jgi:hypothetical protein
MALRAIFQGDSLTRLLQGAAAGVVATLIIGFNWGGWGNRRNGQGNGAKGRQHCPRVGLVSYLR